MIVDAKGQPYVNGYDVTEAENYAAFFQERLWELEQQLLEQNWRRLGDTETDFSRDALTSLIKMSRMFYLKNPLISQGVDVQARYVWGQGVTTKAEDDTVDEYLQTFLQSNGKALFSHQSRMMAERDLAVEGNKFFALFTSRQTGEVKIRSVPTLTVTEIVSNPDDGSDVWFYRRRWTQQDLSGATTKDLEAYYPDWQYNPSRKPPTFRGKQIFWDAPIYHVRVGCLSDMKFGVPETYQSLDWARAYTKFLEDWSTISNALSRFAARISHKGGAGTTAAMKSRLKTTQTDSTSETNPPPVTGATFIAPEGVRYEPIPMRGVTISPEDGRRLLLMAAAGLGLPETFFGDVSVGTLATATSLDRPTELKFRERQSLWHDVDQDIYGYVIAKSLEAPQGALRGDPERTVTETFPSILEHNLTEVVGAIVRAATLDGKPLAGTLEAEKVTALLLSALGDREIDAAVESGTVEAVSRAAAKTLAETARKLQQELS